MVGDKSARPEVLTFLRDARVERWFRRLVVGSNAPRGEDSWGKEENDGEGENVRLDSS